MTATVNTSWHRSLRYLLDGIVDHDVPECDIEFVTLDSRLVKPGSLFLATNGLQRHGLEFAQQAYANGAVAVLFEPARGVVAPFAPPGKVCLPINHLSMHVGSIAARFFDDPSVAMKVCGVTGTNGKTTTTHLIAMAARFLGQRCGQMGTLGFGLTDPLTDSEMTTPDAVCVQQRLGWIREQRATHVAMEVSSHALDQHRVNGVSFDTAVFTNLSRDHLDYHADLEAYAAAKRRLFEQFPITHAVINSDDVQGRKLVKQICDQVPVSVVGTRPAVFEGVKANLYATQIDAHANGLRVHFAGTEGEGVIDAALLGEFNALNLLSALAVLLHWGVPFEQAVSSLGAVKPPPGRMESFGRDGEARFVIDFAHTPDALANAVRALRPHCSGTLWCVFGCGGDRDRGKRPLMAQAAQGADQVVVTNDNPRFEEPAQIIDEIMQGFDDRDAVRVEPDRVKAIHDVFAEAKAGDVVLIAGKGHEDYQIIGNQKLSLCDRVIVNELLLARGAHVDG